MLLVLKPLQVSQGSVKKNGLNPQAMLSLVRLWLGLCAFRPYYDTFGEQKALDGKRVQYSNEFSVSEYNGTCHYQIVRAYMKAESGASHPSNVHQIRQREPTVNTNESEEKVVDSILGIPITEKGLIPLEFWNNMSHDEKTKFLAEKQALVDNDYIYFKTHPDKSDNNRIQHKVKVKNKGSGVTMILTLLGFHQL